MAKTYLAMVTILVISLCTGCASYYRDSRLNPVRPNGESKVKLMELDKSIDTNPVEPGWYFYNFHENRHQPFGFSFIKDDQRDVIKLESKNSVTKIFREVDFILNDYPYLEWQWKVEKNIPTGTLQKPENDQPARIILTFETAINEQRSLQLIWGNEALKKETFIDDQVPHIVLRNDQNPTGNWQQEKINLEDTIRKFWPHSGSIRLTDIGLASDSEDSHQETVAFFSEIYLNKD